MRIIIYLHQYPAFGGIETVTSMLARQFIEDGHYVRIVSFQSQAGTSLLDELPRDTWYKLPVNDIAALENYRALCSELQKCAPDIILFQDSYAPIEGVLWAAKSAVCPHVPVVVAEHSMPRATFPYQFRLDNIRDILRDLILVLGAPYLYWRRFYILRKRRRKLHEKASAYVLLSKHYEHAERWISGWHDRSHVYFIPNPVRLPTERFTLPVKQKQVLTISSLIDSKRVDRLIEIWSKVEPWFPDWTFIIVGDGAERINLERQAKLLQLSNIRFEGFRTETEPYYQEAALFVMASDFEGWPMVLGEAMQHGCVPIVYDSFKSCHDIINHGKDGIIVEHFNQGLFVEQLRRLMSSSGLLRSLQRFAILQADKFCIRKISSRWYDLFHTLMVG